MEKQNFRIYWTLTSDATPHQRYVDIPYTLPTDSVGDPLVDAILALPKSGKEGLLKLPGQFSVPPTQEQILVELAAERERLLAEKTADDEKQREESLEHARRFLADPDCEWYCHRQHIGGGKILAFTYDADLPADLRAAVLEKIEQYKAERERRDAEELEERKQRQIANEKRQAEEKAERAVRLDRRAAYIKEWAAKHGSKKLRGQIALGLEGWPQYLHERLASDFADPDYDYKVELNQNAGAGEEPLANPSDDLVAAGLALRERLVSLGFSEPKVKLVRIEWANEDEDEENEYSYAAIFDRYRPGPEDSFDEKSIRIIVGEK
ncbi:MAG: hypothetical protein C4523_16725 [Myxococcales bacterium]|nr:MAG: hypothetical protein C4523_16725 [Myxococcales bacterium]